MFSSAFRQVFALDRAQLRARSSVLCIVTIAVALLSGVFLHRPAIGMIAAGGAMPIGLGSFQLLGNSRIRPMLWTSIGMAISACAGSFIGHSGPGAVLDATLVGFLGGMLQALGPGAAWVGLQCGIVALVASGYPAGMDVAFSRGLLILAGGLLQTGVVATFWRLARSPWKTGATGDDPFPGLLAGLRALREQLSPRSEIFRFALRQSVTLAAGVGVAQCFHLLNGYWIPMTALLVMRPDFQQTFHRGLARIAGTLVGAILATVVVTELQPDLLMLAALIVLFAWMAYAVVMVNYGAFSICLTAYIVFLLAFAGLPARAVVLHRTLNTTLGGSLALLSYVTLLWVRRHAPPATTAPGQHEGAAG